MVPGAAGSHAHRYLISVAEDLGLGGPDLTGNRSRHLDAIADTFDLYSTSDRDHFIDLLKKRDVSFILFNSKEGVRQAIRQAFTARNGWIPTDQEVMQTAMAYYTQMYVEEATRGERLGFRTEDMKALTPKWYIVFTGRTVLPDAPPAPDAELPATDATQP